MKSAIAVITYNRLPVLQETLSGLSQHCSRYPTAIFDDCGQRDGTETFLRGPARPTKLIRARKDLLADQVDGQHLGPNVQVFLGGINLGVAGNSNRALKWFSETDCDHLILMNDDLHVRGDFVNFYAQAHADLGIGFFSFCDFTNHESYRWINVNWRGYRLKLCPRMTGIVISITREVLERVGYFDARFGKFGQEHCDYTNRARFAGLMSIDGQPQPQIDLTMIPPLLEHQECETSVFGSDRIRANQEADTALRYVAARYGQEPIYREFRLRVPKFAAGTASLGIPTEHLQPYTAVDVPA